MVWIWTQYLSVGWVNVFMLLAAGYLLFWSLVAATPRGRATLLTLLSEARRLIKRS
jgi:PST family polysaccharide transporter